MLRKRVQLGLIHAAVAITLVPINSTLNRVMIKELAISATLVVVLATLPYLFSPVQVLIGSYADRHPLWGFRRTPYILLGLGLCVAGLLLSPYAAYEIAADPAAGFLLGLLAFGAWGMGYNFAAVSYLSLASEISGEKEHSRTIAVMFFIMILSIILSAVGLSRLVDPYTPEKMISAFRIVGLAALFVGLAGLVRLETRCQARSLANPAGSKPSERYSLREVARELASNTPAAFFFLYLTILLAAILGQDVLLEPFGGEAFGLSVQETTRITSVWGTCMLLSLSAAGFLESRLGKRAIARVGGALALVGFICIAASGYVVSQSIFYVGVFFLGVGTGLATVSNLSLMLDMITPGKVGLYMGAWGMANAFSRFVGSLVGGVVRDTVSLAAANASTGYIVVFLIEAGFLLVSLWMLGRIDVSAFRRHAAPLSVAERAAIAHDS